MNYIRLFGKLRPFVKSYRWLIYGILVLTLIGSFTAQVNAWILKYAVDSIANLLDAADRMEQGWKVLTTIAIILLSKEVVNLGIQYGQKFYGEKLRVLVSHELAQNIIDRILTYRLAFFTSQENESGKLQTRIDRGIESLTRLIQLFYINILPLFANAVVALFFMFQSNIYIGLVGLILVPIYFFITQYQADYLSGWRRRLRDFREKKSHGIINIIESIAVIKSFNTESIESEKQLAIQRDMTENQLETRRANFLFNSIKMFVEQIGVVIIILLSSYLVLKGDITIGAIMFNIMLFNNVSAPIRQLHMIIDQINDAMIYSESYFDILEAESEIEASGDYKPTQIKGFFEVEDVSFTYPNGTPALHDVHLDIAPNKITALVGLSGAGKSTIINLLDKFYAPSAGRILLDGVDLEDYDTQFLREQIGLVLQKNQIFNSSIEDNIRYGKPEASKDMIIEAARKAYIHDQIMALPEGYQTKATELSGGQQQRLAIARMFLKNPPIIFLDEPTASLDAIATEQIKNSIDAIKKDRTVVIISHSLSQIIDADYIYSIRDGRVVEQGTHEEVYAQDGVYKEIFDASARSMNIEKIAKTLEM